MPANRYSPVMGGAPKRPVSKKPSKRAAKNALARDTKASGVARGPSLRAQQYRSAMAAGRGLKG